MMNAFGKLKLNKIVLKLKKNKKKNEEKFFFFKFLNLPVQPGLQEH
jgi:hypothetical protein